MTVAVTLSIPGLFGPMQDLEQPGFDFSTPGFDWLLARGQHVSDNPEVSGAPHSLAACSYFSDTGYWPDKPVLLAEPIHLRADQRHVRAYGSELLRLSPGEADQLAAALNQLVEDDGLRFEVCRPGRWYLHLNFEHGMHFLSPQEVLGKAIDDYLPVGSDAGKWHGWFNEWQMLLFNHPVNQSRASSKQLQANGVWVWGEQSENWPALKDGCRVLTDDAGFTGYARAQGHPVMSLPERFNADLLLPGTDLFLVLNQLIRPQAYQDSEQWLSSVQKLEQDWLLPIIDFFRSRRVKTLTLLVPDEPHWHRFDVEKRFFRSFWHKQGHLRSWITNG